MKSYFFNAEPSEDIILHPSGYDREYDANDHANFFEPFFTVAGVMAGTNAAACKVTVKSGSTLKIDAGCAYVRGRMVQFDGTETIYTEADCKIVARMNKTADVRGFQLLAVTTLVQTEDIYDLQLASVRITPVMGGFEAQVTDTRTYLAFTGQPPYYPPDSDSLPYVLWLYTLGFPMTAAQRASVTENPSLMNIFNASLGAMKTSTVTFTASQWSSGTLTIAKAAHGRVGAKFGYTIRHSTAGKLLTNTWAITETSVSYETSTGNIKLTTPTAYAGEIVFFG